MRTVYEDYWFTSVAQRLFGSIKNADVRLDAVTWALAREPDFSRYPTVGRLGGLPLYAIKTQPLAAFPSIVVYFTVSANDQHINLHDLMVSLSPGAVPMPLRPMIPGPVAPVRPIKKP